MQNISKILTACAVLFLAGCATLPSPEKVKAETVNFTLPKLPEKGKAVAYVVRLPPEPPPASPPASASQTPSQSQRLMPLLLQLHKVS